MKNGPTTSGVPSFNSFGRRTHTRRNSNSELDLHKPLGTFRNELRQILKFLVRMMGHVGVNGYGGQTEAKIIAQSQRNGRVTTGIARVCVRFENDETIEKSFVNRIFIRIVVVICIRILVQMKSWMDHKQMYK